MRPVRRIDAWTGSRWRLLEHHAIDVQASPRDALDAIALVRLREMPAVSALLSLRGIPYSKEMTLREFFSTGRFVLLEEGPVDGDDAQGHRAVEFVFGTLKPGPSASGTARHPRTPAEFHEALPVARFAAIGTVCAEPIAGGTHLWSETWAITTGRRTRLFFGAYWLAIGPFSAWTRRMFLQAARVRVDAMRAEAVRSPDPLG